MPSDHISSVTAYGVDRGEGTFVTRTRERQLFADKLFDCCWVELHGHARPQLVVQKTMKPKIFRIADMLYDERGSALPVNADAPQVLVIYNTTISPRRYVA